MTLIANIQEFYKFLPEHLPKRSIPLNKEDIQLSMKYPPNDSQKEAICVCMNNIVGGIHGPPGTGKTQTIANFLEFFLQNASSPQRILISAFSYHALYVILEKIMQSKNSRDLPSMVSNVQRIYIRGENREPLNPTEANDYMINQNGTHYYNGRTMKSAKLNLENISEGHVIFFGNPNQIHKLYNIGPNYFSFNLIIIDEASQMPIDQFLIPLNYINDFPIEVLKDTTKDLKSTEYIKKPDNLDFESLTKIVIVGDHFQLPPVQMIKPPEKLKIILGSLFEFYIHVHNIAHKQLTINYRSHPDIVEYTNSIDLYSEKIIPFRSIEESQIDIEKFDNWKTYATEDWIKDSLDPKKVVCTIIHSKTNYESAVSEIEGNIIADLIVEIYNLFQPGDETSELDFWNNKIGVVAPHNAQGQFIIQTVYDKIVNITNSHLQEDELMNVLQKIIVSVEKFQGSDREIILASIGISSKDQLLSEEDFIYDLNRFNVLTSRAKAKCILVCSSNFLNYIPKDREILIYAGRIRQYAYQFCQNERKFDYTNSNESLNQEIILRFH